MKSKNKQRKINQKKKRQNKSTTKSSGNSQQEAQSTSSPTNNHANISTTTRANCNKNKLSKDITSVSNKLSKTIPYSQDSSISLQTNNQSLSKSLSNSHTNECKLIISRDPYCIRFSLIFKAVNFLINTKDLETVFNKHVYYSKYAESEHIPRFGLDLTSWPIFYLQNESFSSCPSEPLPKMSEEVKPMSARAAQRPSYLIERDRHVFGGCMDEEAEDEFFISSGAVYQSWPYVYEPGYRVKPLIDYKSIKPRLSRSLNCLNTPLDEDTHGDGGSNEDEALPAYSLENFEINLFHVNEAKKSGGKKKRRRIKRIEMTVDDFNEIYNQNLIDSDNLVIRDMNEDGLSSASFLSVSFSSECLSNYNCENPIQNLTNNNNNLYYYYYSESEDDEEDSDGSDDDDSDSFIAYKRRHAIGLPISNGEGQLRQHNADLNSSVRSLKRCRLSNALSEQNNHQNGSLCFGEDRKKKRVCFLSQKKVNDSYYYLKDYALLANQHERNMYTSTLII
jgi:hypothetical protein